MTEHPIIPDVQGKPDQRRIPITRVGIRDLRLPIMVARADGSAMATVAQAEMLVALPEDKKGTHMSRFIRMLDSTKALTIAGLYALHDKMLTQLHAEEGTILLSFPFFIEKTAPVSGEKSLLDYNVSFLVDGRIEHPEVEVEVAVPVTSLCPCSKEISKYGAHNQRSEIIITALFDRQRPFTVEDLVKIGEAGASCEIWSMLKRPDEKFVTEHAYENPKFVEDIVRDVALALNADPRISAYRISSENFESIHNHSAYALIEHDKRD